MLHRRRAINRTALEGQVVRVDRLRTTIRVVLPTIRGRAGHHLPTIRGRADRRLHRITGRVTGDAPAKARLHRPRLVSMAGMTVRRPVARLLAGTARRLPVVGMDRRLLEGGTVTGTARRATLTRRGSTINRSITSVTTRNRSSRPTRVVGDSGSSESGYRCDSCCLKPDTFRRCELDVRSAGIFSVWV
jgi:hypothetical protein